MLAKWLRIGMRIVTPVSNEPAKILGFHNDNDTVGISCDNGEVFRKHKYEEVEVVSYIYEDKLMKHQENLRELEETIRKHKETAKHNWSPDYEKLLNIQLEVHRMAQDNLKRMDRFEEVSDRLRKQKQEQAEKEELLCSG